MSASRRPTTSPRWARATARLTVTEDLPTPPLPDDTARIRAVAGMSVARARSSCALRRARSMRAPRSAASISPMTTSTEAHAGQASHPGLDVGPELGAQGTAGDGQGHLHLDPAVGVHGHGADHAQIDDVVAELGVDDPQQGGAHRLLGWGRGRRGHSTDPTVHLVRDGPNWPIDLVSGSVRGQPPIKCVQKHVGPVPRASVPEAASGGGSTVTTMSSVSISRKPSVITLSDSAIAKVTDLLAQEGNDALALRVAVRPGGCSGYSYEMFFDSETSDDDVVTTRARSRWSWTPPAPSC